MGKWLSHIKKETGEVQARIVGQANKVMTIFQARLVDKSPFGNPRDWIYRSTSPKGYYPGGYTLNWQISTGANAEVAQMPSSVRSKESVRAESKKNAEHFMNKFESIGNLGFPSLRYPTEFYVVNNIPYAKRLEEGHSGQAPYGILKLVSFEWSQIVREAKNS
jgi:hypothetical protein